MGGIDPGKARTGRALPCIARFDGHYGGVDADALRCPLVPIAAYRRPFRACLGVRRAFRALLPVKDSVDVPVCLGILGNLAAFDQLIFPPGVRLVLAPGGGSWL